MKKVLICALDWGLGHATRVIPVIHEFEKHDAEVHIASSGAALGLLRLEFPHHHLLELPAYNPHYAGFATIPSLGLQIPKFLKVIRAEHHVVEDYVRENQIEFIISDNRYGCFSERTKSILITHQPNVILPSGFEWMAGLMNGRLNKLIEKFASIWIPDQPGSGLTSPFVQGWPGVPVYIGWLSRFEKSDVKKKYDLMAIVSGPEPQRTKLEKLLTHELSKSEMKSLMVTGEPSLNSQLTKGNLTKINHLQSAEMSTAIQSSDLIIARSGYSTIMDLASLAKQAIFIPTPQQPEQCYLADFLMKNGIALKMEQKKFSLNKAVERSGEYKGLGALGRVDGLLSQAVSKLLNE